MTQDMDHTFLKALRAVIVTTVTMLSGSNAMAGVVVKGNVYGGGNAADVQVNTTVNISAGRVEGNVYGGGNLGDVGTIVKNETDYNYMWTNNPAETYPNYTYNNTGVCYVNITGSTVLVGPAEENATADKDHGNVFGGGKGDDNSKFYCEKGMVYGTNVIISAGTVKGTVFGGGEVGRVEKNTIVTIGEDGASGNTSTPVINGDVFGAGKGLKTHGYSALVRGNPVVTVQGKTLVGGSVYGGGEIASVGKHKVKTSNDPLVPDDAPEDLPVGLPYTLTNTNLGKCTVTIKDNVTVTGNVFGAGQGVDDYVFDEDFKRMGMSDWEPFADAAAYHVFLQTLALATDTHVTIEGNANVNGSVFGGSESGFVQYDTYVTIKGGVIGVDVYGGGRGLTDNIIAGRVNGNINVNILGGTVTRDVYGGAALAKSNAKSTSSTSGGENPTTTVTYPTATVNLLGGIIGGDAYGGGLGDANTAADVGNAKVNLNGLEKSYYDASDATMKALFDPLIDKSNSTDLNGYPVIRTTETTVKGAIVNQVFGANNTNGTPLGGVTVHVYGTQNVDYTNISAKVACPVQGEEETAKVYLGRLLTAATKSTGESTTTWLTGTDETILNEANATYGNNSATSEEINTAITKVKTQLESVYDVQAVYGGGNEADFTPDENNASQKAMVIIEGCDYTSIKDVYGGGNAAAVPATEVLILGTKVIDQVFGGGNGINGPQAAANVGFHRTSETTKVDYSKGSGTTYVMLVAGTIHNVFGGSNSNGDIRGGANTVMPPKNNYVESYSCCDNLITQNVYGGGKNANMSSGTSVVLGCMPNDWIDEIYAGSQEADVEGDVSLTITSGKFERVFGGNKTSGIIKGSITVNIEETGACDNVPIIIGELYGGGYKAKYSVYGYNNDKSPRTKAEYNTWYAGLSADDKAKPENQPYDNPKLNVRSFTSIGSIYGGGFEADMVADPTVNINVVKGIHYNNEAIHTTTVEGVKYLAAGTTLKYQLPYPAHKLGEIGAIGNVFGGGNLAVVDGNSTVNIGTETKAYFITEPVNYRTGSEPMTPVASGDYAGLYEVTVEGANITGNVYGGGNQANVTGNTQVNICEKEVTVDENLVWQSVTPGTAGVTIGGNVFGAGKGVITNVTKALVVGNGIVKMGGGSVKKSVYGGGELSQVGGDTDITVSGGTIGTSGEGGATYGNVYGGGFGTDTYGTGTGVATIDNYKLFGLIKGNTNITVSGGDILHNVYGGGAYGSVGEFTYDETTGMPTDRKANTSGGIANVTITGGTIGTTGQENGMVFGSSRGNVAAPIDNVDPNDRLAWVYNANVVIGTSGVTTGPLIYGSLYGSGENGHTFNNTNVTLHSGTIGVTTASEATNITEGGKTYSGAEYPNRGNVYGGGCGTDTYSGTVTEVVEGNSVTKTVDMFNPLAGIVRGNATITITGGTVAHNVYGAGAMGSVGKFEKDATTKVITFTNGTGTTTIAISGGTIGVSGTVGDGNVFGAARGNAAVTDRDFALVYETDVTISGTTTTTQIKGNVYGGGEVGNVHTNTKVDIQGGAIARNVFGGGKGVEDLFTCEQAMVGVNDEGACADPALGTNPNKGTSVTVSNGTVGTLNAGVLVEGTGNVYGGGEIGRVEWNTQVTIGESTPSGTTAAPVIRGSVFGAGKGLETHGYSALVRGNSTVTVQGNARVEHNVYGGGEKSTVGRYWVKDIPTTLCDDETKPEAPNVPEGMPYQQRSGGICRVYIQGNANIGPDQGVATETAGHVFGAGKGVNPLFNASTSKKMTKENVLVPFTATTEQTAKDLYLEFLQTLALVTNSYVTINGKAKVKGSVYGGSESGFVQHDTNVKIQGSTCEIGTTNNFGNVFGGGKGLEEFAEAGKVKGNTEVAISAGSINGNVYGGGQRGITLGNVDVDITGGIVEKDVYGGGALADTNVGNWDADGYTEVTDLSAESSVTGLYTRTESGGNYTYTEITDENATYDSGTTYYSKGKWADATLMTRKYTTTVNLTGGTVKGDAYGGGLGQKTGFNNASSNIEAVVWGDIDVNLGSNASGSSATAFYLSNYSGAHEDVVKSGRVFGCNNLNGSPKGDVTVTVWKTVQGNVGRTTDSDHDGKPDKSTAENPVTPTYELAAVYGGGNLADYNTTGKKAHVNIMTCEVSIQDVYGGGNAAKVPGTVVRVYGAYEIQEVFGGGNGKDPYTTDDGTNWVENPGADIDGSANTLLTGGYIHEAYGGSNKKGTITGNVQIDIGTEGSVCDLDVEKMVGAGKDADVNGDLIMILGCKPNTTIPVLYAGADNANVNGDVELTITSGKYGKVFGGNNMGGIIMGHIKLNIEETGDCTVPIEIDELYLGGNHAMYSQYGYYNSGTTAVPVYAARTAEMAAVSDDPNSSTYNTESPNYHPAITAADFGGTAIRKTAPYAQPVLNVISCTYIGKVYGGGLGTDAAIYGNPVVNINMIKGTFADNTTSGVPAKMTAMGLPSTENTDHLGIIGNVYGGGNAADVIGNPTVNICTASKVQLHQSYNAATKTYVMSGDQTVLGAYITGNVYGGGMGEADNFLCDKAMIGKNNDGIANPTGGTTVNIYNGFVRGNVYGGGQIGRVEKNTAVTIGTGGGVAPGGTVTSAPIIMGSVYGGGAGEEEHGYAALVRGNPTVTIQGNAKVRHSVYGGGEIASVARYKVPQTEKEVEDAIAEGYTEAVLGMPYALKDPNSGTCTVTVQGYAEIGPETAMQMTKAGGPDDTGYVFGAGKGILPGGDYEFEQGTTRRMVLYDATVHTTVGQQGSKWQWVDPDHSDTNKNVWEYFEDLDEYIKFIQTLALSSRTYVTITDNAFVKGSVYGGSENGIVQFNTDVKIQGGQIGAGDGMTEPYKETDWAGTTTPTNGWKECASWTFVEPYAPYDQYATTLYEGKYYYDSYHTQEAAGGASVATDGHTYYGNVFGGGSGSVPYFDHTLGRSVYLHSAGQVKGNTNVTISGGHILTNVYGGNEATNVDGTANVTMTDGTVGVPRTDVQIIAHPLTGYIFGGGKGDQRVFFNKDTNVKDAVVTIEGGRVYGSVYGGGEDGHVMRNVTLTIGKQTTTGEGENAVTTTSGPKIGTKGTSYYDGHVFGGGRGFGGDALTAGNVGGSVDVNILDGEILGSVYGGGRLASVGYGLYLVDEEVTIGGETVKPYGTMRPDNVYDDPSKPISDTETATQFFTKGRGHINITISGGTIGNGDEYAYDASNPISHTKGGNVFAGGMGRMYKLDGTTPISSLDWWKLGNVKSTMLTISGDAEIKSCVYGGGELGMVQGGNHTSADSKTVSTEIIINGGTIGTEIKSGNVTQYTFGSVFGGGYGSLTEKLDHTGSTNPTYSTYKYTYPKYIAGRVKGSTEVTMTGGEVKASVYGGGEMAAVGESKVLSTSTDPVVLGETLTGNNGAPILANTYVTISGGTIGKEKVGTTYFGGAKMGNVYGGGSGDNNTVRSGHVYGNTNVNVSNGTIYHNVYGGGAYGSVGDFDYDTKDEEVTVNNQTVTVKKVSGISGLNTNHTNSGVATVNITGGTIGIDGKDNGMVFGSSRGDINQPEERDDHTAWVYNANVTIGTSASGTEDQEGYVAASGPDIKGSVYGSGENGHTFNNTVVTVNGGTIGIASTDDEYMIAVPDPQFPNDRTKDKKYYGAAYPYRGNVYGGGCGTDKYYENHELETHDGNGQLFNPLAGIVYGTTTVNITGGTVVRNVYGAGAMGSVGKTVTTTNESSTTTTVSGGTTTINVSGGTIGVDGTNGDGNVFGAARGDENAIINQAALVKKNTNVSITGGTINGNVYGGGELGCVGTFTVSSDYKTFTWQDTDGTANTPNNNKNTGICNVTVDGSSAVINGHVFGAGKGKDDTFWCEKGIAHSTNVSIKNGTVNRNVYGGGEVGRVETDTEVKVGNGEGTAGGASVPIITGSVFGGGAGVETHGYSALVRGNTKVTVEGNAGVGHNVYGGGEIASVGRYALDSNKMPSILQGGGYCYVTVQGRATIGDDVFGAGKGVTPHFDKTNSDVTKQSRRMTLKSDWQTRVGDDRFDWDYLQDEPTYSKYLETLALATHPEVTIDGNTSISGSVFGGGELGLTKGSVIVNIQGGTITDDVYGGGSLANTNTTNSVDTNGDGVADKTVDPTTTVNLKGGTINRNVYGGGLGQLAKDAEPEVLYTADDEEVIAGTKEVDDVKTPAVAAVDPVEAKVNGDVLVKLNEPTTSEGTPTYGNCVVKGIIFGCNNLNGSPQKNVTVHVYKTVGYGEGHKKKYKTVVVDGVTKTVPDKDNTSFDLKAVYGGGNVATYYPDDVASRATATANVIIDGCDLTSIETVYGGGNAAAAPATHVRVNSCYEIGTVFGGGNGKDALADGTENPGADVGYKTNSEGTGKESYGTGEALAELRGGTIHKAFGGSNTKGNVRTSATVDLNEPDPNECPLCIEEVYGAGNEADQDGTSNINLGCISYLSEIYGGAKKADVNNKIDLTIQSGRFDRVFGGNNLGGNISGTITVNIEETGCHPIVIGQLFGGGNQAAYTAPTGQHGPTVNVKSFTSIGEIYGGGFGNTATVTGDTYVNINECKGKYADRTATEYFTDQNGVDVYENSVRVKVSENTGKWIHFGTDPDDPNKIATVWQPEHREGAIGTIGNVFGGGNEAGVDGSTHIRIGDLEYVDITSNIVPGETDVRDYYIRSGEGEYTEVNGNVTVTAEGNTTYYELVVGEGGTETYNELLNIEVGVTNVSNYYIRSGSEGSYVYSKVPIIAQANTTYCKKVLGVNISGNVYGGGNAADVTGNTNVVIGKEETE